MHDHLIGNQRDDSSEGVAKGLIQSAQLFNEIKSTVLQSADLVHEVLVMVSSETETVNTENTQLRVLLPGQCLLERLFRTLVLAVREEENRSDLIGDFAIPDSFECQVHTAHYAGASRGKQVVDVCGKHDHVLLSDGLQSANTVAAAVEGDDGEPIGRSECFNQETHSLLHQFDLLAIHRPADVDHADQVHTGSRSATGQDGAHGRKYSHLFHLHLGTLSLQLDLHLTLLAHLLHALHEFLVVVEDGRHLLGGLLLSEHVV